MYYGTWVEMTNFFSFKKLSKTRKFLATDHCSLPAAYVERGYSYLTSNHLMSNHLLSKNLTSNLEGRII
jgi:hypothetical protein